MTRFLLVCIFSLLSLAKVHAQPTLHICTVATKATKGFNQLEDSCRYRNINLDVLGFNETFLGNGQKLVFLQNYLQSLPDSDVVMFVDGYDVLILSDAETILETFLSMNHPYVVSGERFCWPLANRQSEFPVLTTSFRYLNSGVFIGYVDVMKLVLNSFSPINPRSDDQGLLSAYYLDHPGELLIDDQCKLFLTMAGVLDGEISFDYPNKRVIFNGGYPCAVHGNGGSRPLYQYIYNQLFLNKQGYE